MQHGRTKICLADEAFARYSENRAPVVQPPVDETDALLCGFLNILGNHLCPKLAPRGT